MHVQACTQHIHTAHAHSTFTQHMQMCTQHMHTAHAHSTFTCTQHMHTAHAHSTCTQHIHITCKCAHSTCTHHMKPLCSVMVRVQIKRYIRTAHTDVTYTIHTHTYTSHTYLEQHTLIFNVIGHDRFFSKTQAKFQNVSTAIQQVVIRKPLMLTTR